jgi:hypothetical protein
MGLVPCRLSCNDGPLRSLAEIRTSFLKKRSKKLLNPAVRAGRNARASV